MRTIIHMTFANPITAPAQNTLVNTQKNMSESDERKMKRGRPSVTDSSLKRKKVQSDT